MSERRPVLLTVSGAIPDETDNDVVNGRRPRPDYKVLAAAFDADLVDVPTALAVHRVLGIVLHRLGGPGALLAWYCFRHRRRYDVIVSDGEQVGLPYALLLQTIGRLSRGHAPQHMMIVHILSTPMKVRLIRFARLAHLVDCYVVYCSWQAEFVAARFGVPQQRIMLSTFMVDSTFFDPARVEVPRRRMICSAGLERRDYPTLMAAVKGLDVAVVIAAASPWSKRSDSTEGRSLPSNVEIRRLSLFELRELYAEAAFVVMPLEQVEFQAGITTILEAMSMRRPVLCSRTPGQTDTIEHDVTGRYVNASDAAALRAAIVKMLDDDAETERLGQAARDWVVAMADVDVYASRLATKVVELRGGASALGAS